MNKFDQFVKHQMKQKYYIRYADDFVFLADSREELEQLLPRVRKFFMGIISILQGNVASWKCVETATGIKK
jgi:RNA-directed DNA polymerase